MTASLLRSGNPGELQERRDRDQLSGERTGPGSSSRRGESQRKPPLLGLRQSPDMGGRGEGPARSEHDGRRPYWILPSL